MLDVAAVAEQLLARESLPGGWKAAFVFLIALHDLGKVGTEFRLMIRKGRAQATRHWEMTEAWLLDDAWLQERLGADPWVMQYLIPAIAGHHGRPSQKNTRLFNRLRDSAGPEAGRDVGEALRALAGLWPAASLDGLDEARAESALGWDARVNWREDRHVEIGLSGAPAGAEVSAIARHPLGRLPDRTLSFRADGAGRFVSAEKLPAGRWQLRISVSDAGRQWRHEVPLP